MIATARAVAGRLPAAVAVLLGRRVAPHPPPVEESSVPLPELRALLDLAAYGHDLDPLWLREATTDGLRGVENLARFERDYRSRRWAAVEAGGWPEPEATWRP